VGKRLALSALPRSKKGKRPEGCEQPLGQPSSLSAARPGFLCAASALPVQGMPVAPENISNWCLTK